MTSRNPHSAIRTPALLGCLLFSCFLFSAGADTIRGYVKDISGDSPLRTQILFTPLSFPLDDGEAVVAGPARRIATRSDGRFTNDFSGGAYDVTIGEYTFRIAVPGDGGTYDLNDLGTNGLVTYTYTNPIPYNVIAGAAGIAVSTNSANFYITNTLPGMSNATETARNISIDGTVTNIGIGDALRIGAGINFLTLSDAASEILADTAAFKVSGAAYADSITATNGVTVTTGGFTNHTASGFVGNGGNLTNLAASSIAAGGTLPALNAANLTNLIWYNVQDYGAAGDGVTVDVTAIQAAVDAAQVAGGGVVYFPAGTYAVDDTIGTSGYNDQNGTPGNICIRSNNVHLVGDGPGGTTIKRTGAGSARNIINSFWTTNVSIRGITFDADVNSGVQNMAAFYTNDTVLVTHTEWKNHDGSDWDALEFAAAQRITVSDSTFTNISANAFAADSTGAGSVQADNLVFDYCGWKPYTFYTNVTTWIPGNWAAFQYRGNYIHAANLQFLNCGTALQGISPYAKFVNCRFQGNSGSDTNVYLFSGETEFVNCLWSDISSGDVAIYASGMTDYGGTSIGSGSRLKIMNCEASLAGTFLVTSNRLHLANSDLTSATPNRTVILSGGTNSVITGNRIANNGNNGIRVVSGAGLQQCVVFGNTFLTSGLTFESGASGSAHNQIAQNIFNQSDLYFEGDSNRVAGNIWLTSGTITINSGQADNLFENNRAASIAGSASLINAQRWINTMGMDSKPFRNYSITTNYTADAIDESLLLNGSSLTLTLPTVATVSGRKTYKIKNVHTTDLTLTNATGSQTIGGGLSWLLPPGGAVEVFSDGSNWLISGSDGATHCASLSIVNSSIAVTGQEAITNFNYSTGRGLSYSATTGEIITKRAGYYLVSVGAAVSFGTGDTWTQLYTNGTAAELGMSSYQDANKRGNSATGILYLPADCTNTVRINEAGSGTMYGAHISLTELR